MRKQCIFMTYEKLKAIVDESKNPLLPFVIVVNIVRGFIGTWLLVNSLILEPGDWGVLSHLPVAGIMVTLVASTLVQMHINKDEDTMFAPLGYSTGLALALFPPQASVIAIVMGFASTVAFRHWTVYFLGLTSAAIIAFLTGGSPIVCVSRGAVIFFPVFVSLLLHKQLVIPVGYVKKVAASRLR